MDKTSGPPVRAILHVGAPKCGSSALQAALSARPVLRGADGRRHVYLAGRPSDDGMVPVRGRRVAAMQRHAVHGYVSWPNVTRHDDARAYWARVAGAIASEAAFGRVPILSSEGWIGHAPALPRVARAAGIDTLDAVAFVRPPLEWLNAVYWQWAVWNVGQFRASDTERWLTRARYDPGPQLAAWARAPQVRLAVQSARADVVAGFAARYGLPLVPGEKVNPAPPPALTGFLLRNRRFRVTPHDSATEFVVQRWCRFPPGPRLWAFGPDMAEAAWPRLREDVVRMMDALPPETAERLLAEPGWTSLDPDRARLREGPSRLDDPGELAVLHDGLASGLRRAVAAARMRGGAAVTAKPAASAPTEDWDAALAGMLDALLAADLRWRRHGALRRLVGL